MVGTYNQTLTADLLRVVPHPGVHTGWVLGINLLTSPTHVDLSKINQNIKENRQVIYVRHPIT